MVNPAEKLTALPRRITRSKEKARQLKEKE